MPKNVSLRTEATPRLISGPMNAVFLKNTYFLKKREVAEPPYEACQNAELTRARIQQNVGPALLRYNLVHEYFAAAFTLDGL